MNTAVDDENSPEFLGIKVPPLPEGQIPLEAFILVKTFDTDLNDTRHFELRSSGLGIHEAGMMALSASDTIRDFLVRSGGSGCGCGDH